MPSISKAPVADIIEAGDQIGDGGFASAGGSDERHHRASWDIQIDIAQDGQVLAIAELHIA